MNAKDRPLDILPGDVFFRLSLVFPEKSLRSDHLLSLGKEFARSWRTRKPNRCDEADEYRDEALEEENIPPRVDRSRCRAPFWDARETRRQQTSKRASHRCGRDVDTNPKEELLALVEGTEVEGHTGHRATFKPAQDGARDKQAGVGCDECGAERDEAKAYDEAGEVESWTNTLEKDITGNLDE